MEAIRKKDKAKAKKVSGSKSKPSKNTCLKAADVCTFKTPDETCTSSLTPLHNVSPFQVECDPVDLAISEEVLSDADVSQNEAPDIEPDTAKIVKEEKEIKIADTITQNTLDIVKPTKAVTLYPSLMNVEKDLDFHSSVIQALSEKFMNKINFISNKSFDEFLENVSLSTKHEFFDLVTSYEQARHSFLAIQNKTTSMQCFLKHSEEKLWDSVQKKISVKGKCDDGSEVTIIQKYEIFDLNESLEKEINSKLSELENIVVPEYTFQYYVVQVAKRKVELYLHYLVQAPFVEADSKLSLSAIFSTLVGKEASKLQTIKTCLSILFHFQRKPTSDFEFITDTRKWLTILNSALMSMGQPFDKLFVFNHILRCPADIHTWGTCLIQLPIAKSQSNFSFVYPTEDIEFCLAALLMTVCPVPWRELLLKDISSCCYNESAYFPECDFTVLSANGDEVEEKYKFRKTFSEEDILGLLKRNPLLQVLYQRSFVPPTDIGGKSQEKQDMERIVSFSNVLLNVSLMGLKTFPSEYNKVVDEVGKFINQILHYLSDSWTMYKQLNFSFSCFLQIEVDRVLFHGVYSLLNKECGTVKFLSSFPYECVSAKVLWNLLWLFHSYPNADESTAFKEKDVDVKLKDEKNRALLQVKLSECHLHDAVQILESLLKMALSPASEKEYKICIAELFFETICCKDYPQRNMSEHVILLLEHLAEVHTFVVSSLLSSISDANDYVMLSAKSVFSSLPLTKWRPDIQVVDVFSKWLLSGVSSIRCQLCRNILSGLNWEFENTCLVLPIEFHREVALLLLKAFIKYDCLSFDGIKQMLHLTITSLTQHGEVDSGFDSWGWGLLFTLKLHVLSHPCPPWIQIYDGDVNNNDFDFPDIYEDASLYHLLSAYNEQHPVACYVVLAMTNTGHTLKYLSKEGLDIVSMLVEKKQFAAAVQLLYFVFPFFVKNQELITENQRFLQNMSILIGADSAKTGVAFSRGTVISKFQEMLKMQLYETQKRTVEFAYPLFKLWIDSLTKLLLLEDRGPLSKNVQIHSVLDLIVKSVYTDRYCRDGLIDLLSEITKPLILMPKRKSYWDSMFTSTDKVSPLLPPLPSASKYSWFAFCITFVEVNQKVIQDLWKAILLHMAVESRVSPDEAFEKFVPAETTLILHSLPIYRWAWVALKMESNHPLLPLVWQYFFSYYLQRTDGLSGIRQNCSIGHRFFEKGSLRKLLEKLKLKLKAAIDFYQKQLEQLKSVYKEISRERKQARFCCGDDCYEFEEIDKGENLFQIFQAYTLWLEDASLHESVCFPALGPNYFAQRLEYVIKDNQSPWFELVDFDKLKKEILPGGALWSSTNTKASTLEESKDLVQTLKSDDFVSKPPLPVEIPAIPVPDVGNISTKSTEELKDIINEDLKVICKEALKFEKDLIMLSEINKKYEKLVPSKYNVVNVEESHQRPCNLHEKCAGAAVFKFMVQHSIMNRQVCTHIILNRKEFLKVLNNLTSPPKSSLYSAAVRVDVLVRKLVMEVKNESAMSSELRDIGKSLFYSQIDKVQELSSIAKSFCSPFKQIFSTCIDVLGKELVFGVEEECNILLNKLLTNPVAAELASQYFCPHKLSVKTFLPIYETLINSIPSHPLCNILVLVSKVKMTDWLLLRKPYTLDRRKLLEIIAIGLIKCDSTSDSDMEPVFHVVKNHFVELLSYEFPELFESSIQFILSVSSTGKLKVDIWYEIFHCLGCRLSVDSEESEIFEAMEKFALHRLLSPDQKIFVSSPSLPLDQVINCLDFFSRYYKKARSEAENRLYDSYKIYLKPISIFLGLMSYSLVELTSHEDFDVQSMWKYLCSAFQPWIDPWTDIHGKNLIFPWGENQVDAKIMMEMFASCIKFLHQYMLSKNLEAHKGLFSCLWRYYVRTYIDHPIRNYSTQVFHSTFTSMPWHEFCPSAEDIKEMEKVLKTEGEEFCVFLDTFILKIPWTSMTVAWSFTETPKSLEHFLISLAKLFARYGFRCFHGYGVTRLNKVFLKILKEMEVLPWQILDLEAVAEILDIFTTLYEPHLVLKSTSKNLCGAALLNFLKCVAGFIPLPIIEMHSNYPPKQLEKKHILFLVSLIEFVKKYFNKCSVDDIGPDIELLCTFVPVYLKEIELILEEYSDSEKIQKTIPLLHELLKFLNFSELEAFKKGTIDYIVIWFNANSGSPLLLPCIKVAPLVLADMSSVVSLVECCISACYDTEFHDSSEAAETWHLVSSYFNVPEDKQDSFIRCCMKQSACFSLYEYVLRRICSIENSQNCEMFFNRIIYWLQEMALNESSETKVLLLWDKVIDLALRVTVGGNQLNARAGLLKFSSLLSSLAEHKGLLSLIRLTKRPSYSVNFQFLCQAMAAFILAQIPDHGTLRLNAHDAGGVQATNEANKSTCNPHPSAEALKALNSLKQLNEKKSYSALKSQVEKVTKCIFNPEYCLLESRALLKELALQVFPNHVYLHLLCS